MLVASVSKEAKVDFAKRGWSGKAYDGSPPIWKSFSYTTGGDDVNLMSSFPGLGDLSKGTEPHKMPWLTQAAKKKNPGSYKTTPSEIGWRPKGLMAKRQRKSLIVPMKDDSGKVVFRTAPLKLRDAWVHPGIAKFNFLNRGVRKARDEFFAWLEVVHPELM
jgi:hypothetical protein